MKHPTLKECPCCGIEARRNATVEPVCKNERYDAYGALLVCQLYWLCRACGCEWPENGLAESPGLKSKAVMCE